LRITQVEDDSLDRIALNQPGETLLKIRGKPLIDRPDPDVAEVILENRAPGDRVRRLRGGLRVGRDQLHARPHFLDETKGRIMSECGFRNVSDIRPDEIENLLKIQRLLLSGMDVAKKTEENTFG
jgi:hypothetical protein